MDVLSSSQIRCLVLQSWRSGYNTALSSLRSLPPGPWFLLVHDRIMLERLYRILDASLNDTLIESKYDLFVSRFWKLHNQRLISFTNRYARLRKFSFPDQ